MPCIEFLGGHSWKLSHLKSTASLVTLVFQRHPYLRPDCTVLEQHDLPVCLMTALRFLEIFSTLFLNIGNTFTYTSSASYTSWCLQNHSWYFSMVWKNTGFHHGFLDLREQNSGKQHTHHISYNLLTKIYIHWTAWQTDSVLTFR